MHEADFMNPHEKDIIKRLRRGKRVNISAIARELGLPISTVADRIRKIDEKYVVKRSSLLDYSKMGYVSNHIIAIRTKPEEKERMLNFLKQQGCVNSIFHTNSNFSFLIEVVFRENFEFINWIEKMRAEFPIEMQSFQILKVEDKERFLPE